MKEIPLTQGHVALVDDEDFELLIQHTWFAGKSYYGKWYAYTNREDGIVSMHRLILELHRGDELIGHHLSGCTLDNQKANLLVCTPVEHAKLHRN